MNKLEEICFHKKKEVEKIKFDKDFFIQNQLIKKPRNFLKSIKSKRKKKYNIITEVKKKSPSKGIIKKNFDPVKIAIEYEKAGACCLSVLTEEKYFLGKLSYIESIKKYVDIPVLRKDFIINEIQIYESFYYGADSILLILAILSDYETIKFYNIAKELNMSVLLEVHDKSELERAKRLNVECIGINNRNLKTLEISLNTFIELSKLIPKGILKVCESGISEQKELSLMERYGANAFLVGHSLMQEKNILNATKKLLTKE